MAKPVACRLAAMRGGPAEIFLFALLALSVGIAGCQVRRAEIEGTVTRKGSPIHAGLIEFTPDLDRGHDGPTVVMRVTDGHFSSRNESAGLSVGPYRVRVTLAAEKPGDALKGETVPSVYQFPFTYSSEPSDSELVFDLQDSQRR